MAEIGPGVPPEYTAATMAWRQRPVAPELLKASVRIACEASSNPTADPLTALINSQEQRKAALRRDQQRIRYLRRLEGLPARQAMTEGLPFTDYFIPDDATLVTNVLAHLSRDGYAESVMCSTLTCVLPPVPTWQQPKRRLGNLFGLKMSKETPFVWPIPLPPHSQYTATSYTDFIDRRVPREGNALFEGTSATWTPTHRGYPITPAIGGMVMACTDGRVRRATQRDIPVCTVVPPDLPLEKISLGPNPAVQWEPAIWTEAGSSEAHTGYELRVGPGNTDPSALRFQGMRYKSEAPPSPPPSERDRLTAMLQTD